MAALDITYIIYNINNTDILKQVFLIKKSSFNVQQKYNMAENLVIVESPAKKKIIQNFLGYNYVVESCIGHIRDLPKKGGMAIDVKNGFEPNYVISDDKKKIVKHLKLLAKKSSQSFLP